ncbi:MAG: UDP-N-acetylglucosamine 2-epimerase [Aliiglaciecola sp.]|uniref:UDP-N-acetylglucosamine 2-epimerase n=1 Tax=Aliiglaciecola sp. M165 TaxID=2593649 RepID=UPI00117DF6C6|nr:UDP-N-acetylglucosamine 2-epimerase [Aliiglaciecola sp. M165]TRY30949.1 UDP-N-acetylglucosamine 2-epimerase (hydrolyzing) [Aliiglaciecola sp. M165]
MKANKKVIAVTGIRSEYDILYPVLKQLNRDEKFDLRIVASGAHLSLEHGNTVDKIIEDGFEIVERIDTLFSTSRLTQRPKAVAALVMGLSQTVERVKPDMLLVVGDREESIATAIVGNYMGVLVVHIGGGDPVFGNADDPIRMAVSKLAHVHFTTTDLYAQNLIKLGEEKWRIEFSGTPGLDNIVNEAELSLEDVSEHLGFYLKDFIVLIKHPLSSEIGEAFSQMKIALEATEKFCQQNGFKCVVIQPNSDPGSCQVQKAIQAHQNDNFFYTKTLPRNIFVNMLRHAKALVGNSSMGLLEAPMYKLPVVNVGHRQQGRLNAGNVEFVEHDVDKIVCAIEKASLDKVYRQNVAELVNPYGDGLAAKRVVSFLASIEPADYKKWHFKKQLIGK